MDQKLFFYIFSIFLISQHLVVHGLRLDTKLTQTVTFAAEQYSKVLADNPIGRDEYPHQGTPNSATWDINSGSSSWTAGFYPGVLWYLHRLTNDVKWSSAATAAQEGLRWRQNDVATHDVGFVIMSSFGLGYLSGFGHGNDLDDWQSVIVQTARSLVTRYVSNAHVLRSWNNAAWNGGKDGECLVIIDNMMNLDLLFTAGELTGDSNLIDIATTHALTTMSNHFRPENFSTYHVVVYDENDGHVIRKFQHQGYQDWSTWSRGQAWSILGYAEAYRWTGHPEFLAASEKAAAYFIQNLKTEDSIPYWDFDAGELSAGYQPRDTSAAAVAALGLLNLWELTGGVDYLTVCETIVESLVDNYAARGGGIQIPAIIVNGTVNYNQAMSDTAIIYGDFYLLKFIDKYLSLSH